MTFVIKFDTDLVKMNQRVRYLDQKVILFENYCPHTHSTDCFTWTTKVVSKYSIYRNKPEYDVDGCVRICGNIRRIWITE